MRLNQGLWIDKLMCVCVMGLIWERVTRVYSEYSTSSVIKVRSIIPISPPVLLVCPLFLASLLLLSLWMSSILSPLLSTALFGSVFGLWRPRGRHAVFSTQSAVSLLSGPDPAILSTHTPSPSLSLSPLSYIFYLSLPFCIIPVFIISPMPYSFLWLLSVVQPTAMSVKVTA